LSLSVPGAAYYTGIDWAAETHAVCVIDAAGKVVARFTIARSAEGLDRLVRRLAAVGDPGDIPVAIERPSGRLVDALLDAGHPVVPVSPDAIKAWRDGEVLSGAKSDPGDAEIIAGYLRLRQHGLRVAPPYADEIKALRVAVRTRDDLVETRVAAVSQLAARGAQSAVTSPVSGRGPARSPQDLLARVGRGRADPVRDPADLAGQGGQSRALPGGERVTRPVSPGSAGR
jgi:transposase